MARLPGRLLAALLAGSLAAPVAGQAPPAQPSPAKTPAQELFEKSLEAAAEALRIYGPWDAPEALDRVAAVGYRVAREANFDDYPISFYLIDMPEPNAFALPGGQVFITRGMLELGLTDDELAALLGHEIAHVVKRHGIRMEKRANLLNVLSQAVLMGVLLAGNNDRNVAKGVPDPYGVYNTKDRPEGNIVYGSYAASVIISELLLRSYSREYEDEADEEGQRWASAAGFATDGTERLMSTLGSRLPDSSKEYGYWRTHPFFDQRIAAARIRKQGLSIGTPRSADEFRTRSQAALLQLASRITVKEPDAREKGRRPGGDRGPEDREGPGGEERRHHRELSPVELVHAAALTAWPRGPAAEDLRRERLAAERRERLAGAPLARDYGSLLASYDREIASLRTLTPDSSALTAFVAERDALAAERDALEPQAVEVWKSGIYETSFLETFLGNFPQSGEVPEIRLALGEAYARLGRQADAVEQFLGCWKAAPESDAAATAQRGLRALAPALDELTALAELADQGQDEELQHLAAERLARQAAVYTDLEDGAAYLKRYPAASQTETVATRLNALADSLYGEVVLYQSVGDPIKAIERIQKILTYAPGSPAAERLLSKVELAG